MDNSDLTREERETHLNVVASDRSKWEVYSDDPVMWARLEKVKSKLVNTTSVGRFYELEFSQVRLYPPVTEAARNTGVLAAKRLNRGNHE
jgi:hypothetical protein